MSLRRVAFPRNSVESRVKGCKTLTCRARIRDNVASSGTEMFRVHERNLPLNLFSSSIWQFVTSSMFENVGRVRLLYIVLGVLLLVGLLPLVLAGTLL